MTLDNTDKRRFEGARGVKYARTATAEERAARLARKHEGRILMETLPADAVGNEWVLLGEWAADKFPCVSAARDWELVHCYARAAYIRVGTSARLHFNRAELDEAWAAWCADWERRKRDLERSWISGVEASKVMGVGLSTCRAWMALRHVPFKTFKIPGMGRGHGMKWYKRVVFEREFASRGEREIVPEEKLEALRGEWCLYREMKEMLRACQTILNKYLHRYNIERRRILIVRNGKGMECWLFRRADVESAAADLNAARQRALEQLMGKLS